MISIITPSYNRKDMLSEVIQCIARQTYKDVELIVVDDCSTDGTEDMMKGCEKIEWIHYYRNKQNIKDPGLNRHFGFLRAHGEYVVFMDDDDFYIDDNFFMKAMEVFDNNVDANLVMVSANSFMEFADKNNMRKKRPIGVQGYVEGKDFLLNMGGNYTGKKYRKPLSTFTTVFVRQKLCEADFGTMKMMNDYAIYLRALLFGNVYIMEDYVGVYRIHKSNISSMISSEFLMKNMEERVWVKEHMTNKVTEQQINKWWEKQLKIMLVYYLTGTVPSSEEQKKVYKWASRHSQHTVGYYKTIVVSKIAGFCARLKKGVKLIRG